MRCRTVVQRLDRVAAGHVLGQGGGLGERAAAQVAAELVDGAGACAVAGQHDGRRRRHAARLADGHQDGVSAVRRLRVDVVQVHVHLQVLQLRKGLLADAAQEGVHRLLVLVAGAVRLGQQIVGVIGNRADVHRTAVGLVHFVEGCVEVLQANLAALQQEAIGGRSDRHGCVDDGHAGLLVDEVRVLVVGDELLRLLYLLR